MTPGASAIGIPLWSYAPRRRIETGQTTKSARGPRLVVPNSPSPRLAARRHDHTGPSADMRRDRRNRPFAEATRGGNRTPQGPVTSNDVAAAETCEPKHNTCPPQKQRVALPPANKRASRSHAGAALCWPSPVIPHPSTDRIACAHPTSFRHPLMRRL